MNSPVHPFVPSTPAPTPLVPFLCLSLPSFVPWSSFHLYSNIPHRISTAHHFLCPPFLLCLPSLSLSFAPPAHRRSYQRLSPPAARFSPFLIRLHAFNPQPRFSVTIKSFFYPSSIVSPRRIFSRPRNAPFWHPGKNQQHWIQFYPSTRTGIISSDYRTLCL